MPPKRKHHVKWHHKEHKLKHKGKVQHELSEKIEFMIFFSFASMLMGIVLLVFFLPAVFLPMVMVPDTLDTLPRYDLWEVMTGGDISGSSTVSDLQIVDVKNEAVAFVLAGFSFVVLSLYYLKRLERSLEVSFLKLLRIDSEYMLKKSKFKEDYMIITASILGAMFLATAFVVHTFFLVGFSTTSIILNMAVIICLLAFLVVSYRLTLNIFDPDSRMAKLLTRGK
jgi:hypothetical protein